jgi:hypothetical protein
MFFLKQIVNSLYGFLSLCKNNNYDFHERLFWGSIKLRFSLSEIKINLFNESWLDYFENSGAKHK